MDNLHQELLKLLKEIDQICKENNIKYYLAGGTAIGAIRHNGFIPWDDDADIYMPRSEFLKFKKIIAEIKIPNRLIDCIENNKDYMNTVARYMNMETTFLVRTDALSKTPKGLSIDIFILDPIPAEKEEQERYRALLNIYADFLNPIYAYSYRNPLKFDEDYFGYTKYYRENGRETALELLEKEIFAYPEEKANHYLLRWGTVPTIFEKKIFGEPKYFPFEGEYFPVPQNWYEYLSILYGDLWMDIPDRLDNQGHICITDLTKPSKIYQKDIDVEKAIKEFFIRSENMYFKEKYNAEYLEYLIKVQKKVIKATLGKLNLPKYDFYTLREEGKFDEILEIFEDFIRVQFDKELIGRLNHINVKKYYYPETLPIEEEHLWHIVYAFIGMGQLNKAKRLLSIFGKNDNIKSDDYRYVTKLYERAVELNKLYYSERYEDAEELLKEFSQNILKTFKRIREIYFLTKSKTITDIKELNDLLEQIDDCLEIEENFTLLKAKGDLLTKINKKEESINEYNRALVGLRNGLLALDIERKVGIKPSFDMQNNSIVPMDNITKAQLELLIEICEICKENNIDYFLNKEITNYIYHWGVLPNKASLNGLVMDFQNAEKLKKIFTQANKSQRLLVTDENNPSYCDSKYIYINTNTTNIKIDRLFTKKYQEISGIGIEILMLQKKHGGKFTNKVSGVISRGLRICDEQNVKYLSKRIFIISSVMKLFQTMFGINRINKWSFNKNLKNYIKNSKEKKFVLAVDQFYKAKRIYIDQEEFKSKDIVKIGEVRFDILKGWIKERPAQIVGNQFDINSIVTTNMPIGDLIKEAKFKAPNESAVLSYKKSTKYTWKYYVINKNTNRYWKSMIENYEKQKS